MENKIRKVQRWLERCVEACKSRSWENALADMECATAELESARKELWSVVDGSRAAARSRRRTRRLEASFVATILVLMSAIPVAMPEPVRKAVQSMGWEDQRAMLEFLTRDEKALITSLRKSLSSANRFEGIEDRNNIPSVASEVSVASVPRTAPKRESKPLRIKILKDADGPIALDEMVQLLEIGQRALRGNEGLIILEEQGKK